MICYYFVFLFELEVFFFKNNYIDIFSVLVIFKVIVMIKKEYFRLFILYNFRKLVLMNILIIIFCLNFINIFFLVKVMYLCVLYVFLFKMFI